jgi:hypothetical protein
MSSSLIYVLKNKQEIIDIKIIKNKLSIGFLLLGPLCFLFYKMWKYFFVFIAITISLGLLLNYKFISEFEYKVMILCVNLYLALDFSSLRERFLINKEYSLESIK